MAEHAAARGAAVAALVAVVIHAAASADTDQPAAAADGYDNPDGGRFRGAVHVDARAQRD